jgi:hypothetical protein
VLIAFPRGRSRRTTAEADVLFMSTKVKTPTSAELQTVLGSADVVWSGIVRVVEHMVGLLNTRVEGVKDGVWSHVPAQAQEENIALSDA